MESQVLVLGPILTSLGFEGFRSRSSQVLKDTGLSHKPIALSETLNTVTLRLDEIL